MMLQIRLLSSAVVLLIAGSVDGFIPENQRRQYTSMSLKSLEDDKETFSSIQRSSLSAIASFGLALVVAASPAFADGATKDFKFPPIDTSDVNRCVLKGGSSMGQANAARDKLYDLRQCKLSGASAVGYDLSGVSKCQTGCISGCTTIHVWLFYSPIVVSFTVCVFVHWNGESYDKH